MKYSDTKAEAERIMTEAIEVYATECDKIIKHAYIEVACTARSHVERGKYGNPTLGVAIADLDSQFESAIKAAMHRYRIATSAVAPIEHRGATITPVEGGLWAVAFSPTEGGGWQTTGATSLARARARIDIIMGENDS